MIDEAEGELAGMRTFVDDKVVKWVKVADVENMLDRLANEYVPDHQTRSRRVFGQLSDDASRGSWALFATADEAARRHPTSKRRSASSPWAPSDRRITGAVR